MPVDVQHPYRAFVGKMCLDLMNSSRTYLWFGAKVSEDEKKALVAVVQALGIPMEDELREVIGERVRDLKRA